MAVLSDLSRFGPHQTAPVSLAEARRYCRKLARAHYENFSVASFLLPREMRRHFYNVYAYCRWADDLADETGDPRQSFALLKWWEEELENCYAGQRRHPVFVALGETIAAFNLPREPFHDLLVAFRRDQTQRGYETFDELLQYCRYSANPVGRLVLCLGECFSEENGALSDSICTGLQLANFWQDVAIDYDRGRIYLPRQARLRHGYCDEMFARRQVNDSFRGLLEEEVNRAEDFLLAGKPLIPRVPRWLRVDISLFLRGGLAILQQLRKQQYDVWSRRPKINRGTKLKLLLQAWLRPELE